MRGGKKVFRGNLLMGGRWARAMEVQLSDPINESPQAAATPVTSVRVHGRVCARVRRSTVRSVGAIGEVL